MLIIIVLWKYPIGRIFVLRTGVLSCSRWGTHTNSTRNCDFRPQVSWDRSDKKPSFLADYQRITAFVLFHRDRRDRHIFGKNRHFLSEISVTHATPCRDNLTSNYPDFWKNANNHTIRERDTKFPEKASFFVWKITDSMLSYRKEILE